jgi:hypothetical protein
MPCSASYGRREPNMAIQIVKEREYDEETGRCISPAIGCCRCGAKVVLDGFTCVCDRCGREYNWAGSELAPRSQWGEETGETADEILLGVAQDEARRRGF